MDIDRPRPPVPPVTIAVLPLREKSSCTEGRVSEDIWPRCAMVPEVFDKKGGGSGVEV